MALLKPLAFYEKILMKVLSKILSADPRPVTFIVFLISALCGAVIFSGHPSADFVSDHLLTGSELLLCGISGILFLVLGNRFCVGILILIAATTFYYLASASAINGHVYESAIHLVIGLSASWAFVHQNKICMNK